MGKGIGILMLVSVFGLMFSVMVLQEGMRITLTIWAVALILSAVLVIAVKLIAA